MINHVIAGDYKNCVIDMTLTLKVYILEKTMFTKNKIFIDKSTVESFEVVDEQSSKSFASTAIRTAAGAAVLGGAGAIAGAASAKKKSTYKVSITFKDGKRSLVEINGDMYNRLLEILY